MGKKAVEQAQRLGADEAEAYVYLEKHTSVKFVGGIFASRGGAQGIKGMFARLAEPWVEKKGLPFVNSGVRAGVGVRAVVNKGVGFASVSSMDEQRTLEATERAIKIARIRPPDPNWMSLPEPRTSLEKGGIFDEKIESLGVDEMLKLCSDICGYAADYDRRITSAMTAIDASSMSFGIVSTLGTEGLDNGTFFSAIIEFKAKSKGEDVSSGDFVYSRAFVEDLEPVADSVGERTIECLNRKPLTEKYKGPVIFENTSWSELFSAVLPYGISALNVQENRSSLKGKVDQQVASKNVSIFDDGTLANGIGTFKMDDEGVPRQKTFLVDNGILKSFLYDDYSAKREGGKSTGNASRQRAWGSTAYANQPAIGPSNLILSPVGNDLEGMIGEMKNGILVKGSLIGAGHSNAVTGDFSVTSGNAFKIENGAISHSLKPCTVAGNFYEALNSVLSIGNDLKYNGRIVTPSVTIDGIVVST